MRIPLQKLKAIILYFCENTDPKFLGKVKLLKLFYYLDFTHVKLYGSPVTYDRYVNLEHGPIPSAIKNLVDDAGDDLAHSVLADTIEVERREGSDMHRVVPRRPLSEEELKLFSQTELEVLSRVSKRFASANMSAIKEASHKEAPWATTELLEEIPYTLAVRDNDCRVTREEIELALRIGAK